MAQYILYILNQTQTSKSTLEEVDSKRSNSDRSYFGFVLSLAMYHGLIPLFNRP